MITYGFYLWHVQRVEKDCSEWAHQQLKDRLKGIKFDSPYDAQVEVVSVEKVTGDVAVCQRKGRLRHNFDLNISLTWKYLECVGQVTITDFMSDTDSKGFEFSAKGVTNPEVNEMINGALRDRLWDELQKFAEELIEVQGKDLIVPTATADANEPVSSEVREQFKAGTASSSQVEANEPKPSATKDWKSTIIFQASVDDLFRALTDPQLVQMWSRGPLQGSLSVPNTPFTLFSGAVNGRVLEYDSAKHSLKWTWKLSAWSVESTVSIQINKAASGDAEVSISQTGIPRDQFEVTTGNWEKYYWNPIKATFGYGSFLPH